MMWFFFALLTAILWGVGQVFVKKGLDNLSPLFNNLLATVISVIVWIPVALILGVDFHSFLTVYSLALVAGLTYLNLLLCNFKRAGSTDGDHSSNLSANDNYPFNRFSS